MNKQLIVDYCVEYIRDNPGCSTSDLEEFFLQKKRVDGLSLRYTPDKSQIAGLLNLDVRVYNKNRGINRMTSEWYLI